MEYLTIIVRTIFLYCTIVLVLRLMGKREIGELSILDLVVFLMLAEMAVISIEDTSKPMISTLLPMIILLIVQIISAMLSMKSQRFRDIVDGKPSVLINQGNIDEKEMRRQRYNLEDLLVQLREKQIKNVGDVEFAILEPSGKLSVFEKENTENQSQSNDIEKKDPQAPMKVHFPFPVIMDGKVQEQQLKRLGKTNLWLRQELRKQGFRDIKSILLCTVNSDGSLFVEHKDS